MLAVLLKHKAGTAYGLLESGWVIPSVPETIALYIHWLLSLLAIIETKIFPTVESPIKGLTSLRPSRGGGWAVRHLAPTAPGTVAGKGSHPTLKGKILQACLFQKPHPLCPQFIRAAKQSQTRASSEDLPFFCAASLVLEHKLNKICLEISQRFPLDFYLEEAGNPNTNNNSTYMRHLE